MGKSTPRTSWGHQRYIMHLLQRHFRQMKALFLPLSLGPSVSGISRVCGMRTWLAHENTLSEVWDNSRAPRGGTAAVWAAMGRGHGRMLTASRMGQGLETQPRRTSGCQEGLLVSAQVGTLSTSVPALLYLLSPDRDSCGISQYLNASLCRHSDT